MKQEPIDIAGITEDCPQRRHSDDDAFDMEFEQKHDPNHTTLYETYDNVSNDIKAKVSMSPSHLSSAMSSFKHQYHLLAEEVENEVEISDLEEEEDEDDADSVVTAFSNDHNYNMSPITEPVSPISSTTDRSTPDTIHTTDIGYESQLSPTSTSSFSELEDMPMVDLDLFPMWNDLSDTFCIDPISELFPALV